MLISILVPVYNVASYLKEALDSVLAQTFEDWECICVDDGSTDESGTILDAYAAKDARFKVFHQVHAGVSAARNTALELAKGEYISFLDGDDVLLPQRLEVAHTLLSAHPVDLMRLKIMEWNTGDPYSYTPSKQGKGLTTQTEIYDWGVQKLLLEGWTHPLFIRHTTWLKDCRFPIGVQMREDNIFALQVLKYCTRVFVGEDCGYLYRQHPGSAIHTPRQTADAICFLRGLQPLSDFYGVTYRRYFDETIARECSGWARASYWRKATAAEIDAYHHVIRKLLPEQNGFPFYSPFYLTWCGFAFWKWKILWFARIIQALLLFQYHLKQKFRRKLVRQD